MKKSTKSDMSEEAKTEAMHEYMYEKLIDSREKEDEKKTDISMKKKQESPKNQQPVKFKKLDCNRSGAPNWSRQHECPAMRKKCTKCEKIAYFAKC